MTEHDKPSDRFPSATEVVDRLEADVVRAMDGGTGGVTVTAWQETEAHSCQEA